MINESSYIVFIVRGKVKSSWPDSERLRFAVKE